MPTANTVFFAPERAISPAEEAKFFTSLKTANRTFRETRQGRLAGVDDALVKEFALAGSRIDDVLDLGISSGVTTLEMFEALAAGGHSPNVTATDRAVKAKLVDLPYGCRALAEPDGFVLQYEVLGRAFRPWSRRLDYLTGMALLRRAVGAALGGAVARRIEDDRYSREVSLVTPRLTRMPDVRIVEDDITVRNPGLGGRFDLVRAANILNRHYFPPDDLDRAIRNVLSYLAGPRAWLLVVRTHKKSGQQGTLFRVTDAGELAVVRRFGEGSEIEEQVLAAYNGD